MSSTYTTRSGDMFDGISYRVYGSENYMDLLVEANPDHRNVARFNAGVVLVVPEKPTTTERPESLPPWRIA